MPVFLKADTKVPADLPNVYSAAFTGNAVDTGATDGCLSVLVGEKQVLKFTRR